jgi:hypothetical protein
MATHSAPLSANVAWCWSLNAHVSLFGQNHWIITARFSRRQRTSVSSCALSLTGLR